MAFLPRWSILRRIREQSVAEHTFYVCLYSSQLCDLFSHDLQTREWVHRYALYHDVPELATGDIPHPFKYALGRAVYERMTHIENLYMRDTFGPPIAAFLKMIRVSHDPAHVLVKNVVKTADLMDWVFYLATEITLGNTGVGNITNWLANQHTPLGRGMGLLMNQCATLDPGGNLLWPLVMDKIKKHQAPVTSNYYSGPDA